jgi:hypothetical protein
MYESKSIYKTKDKSLKNNSIYFLFLNKKIVYIGTTTDVKRRVTQHKSNKKFDSYYVFKENLTLDEAFFLEKNLVHFVTLFSDGSWYNKENWELVFLRETKLKEECGTVINLGLISNL